jgi:hypothetical protein
MQDGFGFSASFGPPRRSTDVRQNRIQPGLAEDSVLNLEEQEAGMWQVRMPAQHDALNI